MDHDGKFLNLNLELQTQLCDFASVKKQHRRDAEGSDVGAQHPLPKKWVIIDNQSKKPKQLSWCWLNVHVFLLQGTLPMPWTLSAGAWERLCSLASSGVLCPSLAVPISAATPCIPRPNTLPTPLCRAGGFQPTETMTKTGQEEFLSYKMVG